MNLRLQQNVDIFYPNCEIVGQSGSTLIHELSSIIAKFQARPLTSAAVSV
jgi:hypothetical protein